MHRRSFLAIVAAGGAVACSSDDDDPNPKGALPVEDGFELFPQSVASGDPKPTSVVLWTRVELDDESDADVTLQLEVALDPNFEQRVKLDGSDRVSVTAEAAHDWTAKIRVDQLDPDTVYYYRFVFEDQATGRASRVGRTKTAPAADADVEVTFAVVSCQDYNGKYYHAYKHLAEQEVDFFVHLGDYIYETTRDPGFQTGSNDRQTALTDKAGAIVFNEGEENEFFAARSVDNYRELYRTYRSDRDLQRVHELFPMIAVWDDHEFSDDCYGNTASYFDGEKNETDAARRAAADMAWFEFMPVDYAAGPDFRFDPDGAFPGNLEIYRDFTFGKHMHLAMTDLRRYRPDHIIPEDAFPGAVAATDAELTDALGTVPAIAAPYVDIDTYDGGSYRDVLTDAAATHGFPADEFTGNVSVRFINSLLETLNEGSGSPTPLIDETDTSLARGIAYYDCFKRSRFGIIGTRYLVIGEAYEALSRVMYKKSDGASEDMLGKKQKAWFLNSMQSATTTWKIWGNEFTVMRREIDLSQATSLPEAFQVKFRLSAEDWDGSPSEREALLNELGPLENVVAVTGDIHAFFAGTPWADSTPDRRIVEFVCGGVSSGTYRTLLRTQAQGDPALVAAGAEALAASIDVFLTSDSTKPNPHLAYAAADVNGYGILTCRADRLSATFFEISEDKIPIPKLSGAISTHFEAREFEVRSGESAVYMRRDGEFKRWDPDAFAWV